MRANLLFFAQQKDFNPDDVKSEWIAFLATAKDTAMTESIITYFNSMNKKQELMTNWVFTGDEERTLN